MTDILLRRIAYHDTYTIGHLFIDGVYFCDTLEDKVRNIPIEGKTPGQTAIPVGTYAIKMTMSPRFRRVLPMLYNVPYFNGILIHRGNTPEHTAGCILIGENKVKGQVINSAKYEVDLCNRLEKEPEIRITIK